MSIQYNPPDYSPEVNPKMAQSQDNPPAGQRRSAEAGPVEVLSLEPGTKVLLTGNVIAEVVENPRDGYWVICRYVSAPDDPAQVGRQDMVLWSDLKAILDDA